MVALADSEPTSGTLVWSAAAIGATATDAAVPATNNNCAKFRGLGVITILLNAWFPAPALHCCSSHREPGCGCLAPIVVPASVERCVPDGNVATAMMWRRTRRSIGQLPNRSTDARYGVGVVVWHIRWAWPLSSRTSMGSTQRK